MTNREKNGFLIGVMRGVHRMWRFLLARCHESNHWIKTDSTEISKYAESLTRASDVDISGLLDVGSIRLVDFQTPSCPDDSCFFS